MIGNILIATDLSERSEAALERALMLKRQHASGLVIAHIIDQPKSSLDVERRSKAAHKAINSWLLSLDPADRADIAIKVTTGTPQWELGRLAHIHNCDLIVLGAHQYRGGHDLLIGSTMEGLARSGNCALLVVTGKRPGAYDKLLLGIDLSLYARFAVRMAMSLAPQADFTGVHVLPTTPGPDSAPDNSAPEDSNAETEPTALSSETQIAAARAALADFMADTLGRSLPPEVQADVGGRMTLTVRSGDPYAQICAEAGETGAGLLVIGTRGRMGLPHTRLGTTAEKLLNKPPCDVLAVNSW